MKNNFNISGSLNSDKVRLPYVYAFFALISVFIYFNALHSSFLYDDQYFVVQNFYIKNLNLLPKIFTMDVFHFTYESPVNYYRPLQMFSYFWDYFFWKLNPFGYHLHNILIHSLNSFLVFLLISTIFKDKFLALITALLFCIHPINIGVVTVVGGRSNLLEATFMFLSLITLIRHYRNNDKITYALSIFLFVLAILSREGALLLPIFILLCALTLKIDKKKILVSILPYIIIFALYLIFRTHFMPSHRLKLQNLFCLDRFYLFFYLCHDYLLQLILPRGLAIKILPKDLIFIATFIPVSFIYFLLIKTLVSKNKIAIFSFLFYIISLLPLINLSENIPYFSPILAEPYVYVASIGFFLIISYFLLKVYFYFPKSAFFCIILISSFYGALTFINNNNYRNEETFYNYLLSVDPKSSLARINLGNVYYEKKNFNEAKKQADIVLATEPDFWQAYLLLGNVFKEEGNLEKALEMYRKTLTLNPLSTATIINIGLAYKTKGQDDRAINAFKKAIELNPESLVAMQNLADILITRKSYNEALALCDKILKLSPDDTGARVKIGIVLAESGHLQQAESVFKEALKLGPNSVEALRNLGVLYANTGDLNKAISMWTKALDINPDDKETRKNIERAKAIKDSQKH